MQGITQHMK